MQVDPVYTFVLLAILFFLLHLGIYVVIMEGISKAKIEMEEQLSQEENADALLDRISVNLDVCVEGRTGEAAEAETGAGGNPASAEEEQIVNK